MGMTLFQANARMKEISIRKVLGASVASLLALLTRSHMKLILLSSAISLPLIYFIGTEWLSNYPVRIEISPWFFIIPFAIIFVTVLLISCFQTWRAATTNPIDYIKHE
jgi:putative ABC transport system permease protein